MNSLPARCASLVLLALFPSTAAAEGVRIVTAGGELNFGQIQEAVDAAVDGDLLLVAEGSYAGFTIDGKALSVVGVPGALVDVAGVAIRNLGADQTALISGLRVAGVAFAGGGLLKLEDNLGCVRAQDCSFLGGTIGWGVECIPFDGGHGARIVDCERVALLGCQLRGTQGQWQDTFNGNCDGGAGGAGLFSERSRVALYDCELTGGEGGEAKYQPGEGGRGLDARESQVFASGGWIHGGAGGCAYITYCTYLGEGGDGAWLDASTLVALGCEPLPGEGSVPGQAIAGGGTYVALPGAARHLAAPALAAAAGALPVTYQGQPGDSVRLVLAMGAGFLYRPTAFGVQLTQSPGSVLRGPFGTASGTGSLSFPLQLKDLPAGAAQGPLVLQGLAATTALEQRLSGARHVALLSPSVGPDCDGNGVNDYLEIASGTAVDQNHNLIPDVCEPAD